MNRLQRTVLCLLSALVVLLARPPLGRAEQNVLRDLAHRLAPDGQGDPRQLTHYLRSFQDSVLQDHRICAFHVNACAVSDGSVVLTGYAEFVEMRDALIEFLRCLGFESITNNVELFPSRGLGELRFGLVRSAHSLVLTKPSGDSTTATDVMLGEPLFLLHDVAPEFVLCHTGEGYVGFVRQSDILRIDADHFDRWLKGRQVYVTEQWISDRDATIPVGARLRWVAQDLEHVTAESPDGKTWQVPKSICDVRGHVAPRELDRVLATARQFLGTKYVWGGKTRSGVDCSGLVQTAFASSGLHLPRDSNQQVFPGRLVATRWYRRDLRCGDTLYFLGRLGKITHTGLYLGDGQYIEAVTPAVRISSLRQADENYSQRGDTTLAFGKRLLE